LETEIRQLRAVFDTNIFLAAHLSKNPNSPTIELLECWRRGEFELLYSDDLLVEIDEKFSEKGISEECKENFLVELRDEGVYVDVQLSDLRPVITADPDDNFVLACAVVGKATHLVTYDSHFNVLEEEYQGIKIVNGLSFLWAVRESRHQTESASFKA